MPAPPTPIITSIIPGDGQVTFIFSSQAGNGTTIYIREDKNNDEITITGTQSTATFTGLTNDTLYTFSIFAMNVVGTSGYVDPAPTATPTASAGAICFLGNARVLTPSGYRRMDKFRPGDEITTADGRTVNVVNVKVMEAQPGRSTNPYRIPAGLYGAEKEVLISPRHRVAVPGRSMVEARELGLVQKEMAGPWIYYNLELPNWNMDNMVVSGVVVESLAPTRRVQMSVSEFKARIAREYGSAPPREVLRKILAKTRFHSDGTVDTIMVKQMPK